MSSPDDNRSRRNPLQSIVQFGERVYKTVWKNRNTEDTNTEVEAPDIVVRCEDTLDDLGRNSLHRAVISNKIVDLLEALLQIIDVNVEDSFGNTALHYCTSVEAAKLLYDSGAYVNFLNRKLQTPLHILAAKPKGASVLHYLLLKDSDHYFQDELGQTPLHIACQENLLENVRVLLYHGADTTEETDIGYTALMIAAERRHLEIIEELWPYLDYGEVNRLTRGGDTLLMLLMRNKLKHWVLQLLEMDPQLDYIDTHNFDALDLSVFMNDSECFKIIWSRMENKMDFSWNLFLENCCFRREDFLDTLHTLLSSCPSFDDILIQQLLDAFERFHLKSEDCQKVIYSLLSFGYEVKSYADIYIHIIFQSSLSCKYDLFRVIIEFVKYFPLVHKPNFVFIRFVNSKKFYLNDFAPLLGLRYEVMLCNYLQEMNGTHSLNMDDFMLLLTNIRRYLHFTCGSAKLKQTYHKQWGPEAVQGFFGDTEDSQCDASFEDLITATNSNIQILDCIKFPSLLEWCRDFIRERLLQKFHDDPRGVRNMMTAIDDLPLPQTLKEVLLFQKPIYKCELDCCAISPEYFDDIVSNITKLNNKKDITWLL